MYAVLCICICRHHKPADTDYMCNVKLTYMLVRDSKRKSEDVSAQSGLMSCQIMDYQGAPLKLTAALFHLLLPHQLLAETCQRDGESTKSLSSDEGQNGVERVRRG